MKKKFIANALNTTLMAVYLGGAGYASYKLGTNTHKPEEKFGLVKSKEGYSFGFTKDEPSYGGRTALDDETQRQLFVVYVLSSAVLTAAASIAVDKKFGDKKSEPSAPQLVV